MTPAPRPSSSRRPIASFNSRLDERRGRVPLTERLLQAIGASPTFTDAVLGDLAEERARREDEDGTLAARWWYFGEAVRAAPHLFWNVARHGTTRGRAQAAALLAAGPLLLAVIAMTLHWGNPTPASLVVDGQGGGQVFGGVVLNSTRPVQLAMRAFDAKGRPLRSVDVRYRWLAGTPLQVTRGGVATCSTEGDAELRASAGPVVTSVIVHCRPVERILARAMSFIVGDSARPLEFRAIGPDGWRVNELAGELHVEDTTVVRLTGNVLRPIAPGRTLVMIRIGDGVVAVPVAVYEPVQTLAGLRSDQTAVVAPVRLARGDTVRWPLPAGHFWLQYTRADTSRLPALKVEGAVMCLPALGPRTYRTSCLARGAGPSVRIAYPRSGAGEIVGKLWLERRKLP